MIATERLVDFAEELDVLLAIDADDDALGAHAVINRRAFFEEFGVGDHLYTQVAPLLAQSRLDARLNTLGSPHRRGGFVDHHLGLTGVLGDRMGHGENVLHVSAAVFVRWSTNGDENHFGKAHGFCCIGGEAQATR